MIRSVLPLVAVILGGLAVSAVPSVAATNLVLNGGFESLTNGDNQIVPGQTTGQYISSADNWYSTATTANGGYPFLFFATNAVSTGFGDKWDNGQRYLWGAANGGSSTWDGLSSTGTGHYLVMDGDYHATAINQAINGLVKGVTYQLSFSWAAAQWSLNGGGTTEGVQVTLGNQVKSTATYNLASKGFSGWMTETMTFTYDGLSNVLSFIATGGPSGYPPISLLDNVQLYAVPEPGSIALVGAGLAAFTGLHLSRRRKRT